MYRNAFALTLLALIVGGATPVAGRAQAAHPDSLAPRSIDQLTQRYRRAHDQKSMDAMLHLFCWGASGRTEYMAAESDIKWDFGLPIARFQMQPVTHNDSVEYTISGVTYRPSLPPIARVAIEFSPTVKTGGKKQSISYMIGASNGVYCFVMEAPVKK